VADIQAAAIEFPARPEEYRLPVTTLVKVPADPASEADRREYRRTTLVGLAPTWLSARRTDEEPVAFADPVELGNLGHAVLESFDFHNSRNIPARVRQALERLGAESEPLPGLETRVSRAAEFLCGKLADTPPAEVIREMPFCARFEHDGAICVVDGKIDLLYLVAGIWHIVD
jgi:ATP-dependent exoDNAse (exonuclease V) beta subunit